MADEEFKLTPPPSPQAVQPPSGGPPADPGSAGSESARVIPISNLDSSLLVQLEACTRCGECLNWCPVYDQDPREEIIPRRKVLDFLKIAKAQHGLLARLTRGEKAVPQMIKRLAAALGFREPTTAEIEAFVLNLYECSTCGQCQVVCPAGINTVQLWEDIRSSIVRADYGPLPPQKNLVKNVKSYDNPWQQPRAARTKWARRAKKEELILDMPKEIKKKGGKVLLFFGCTAAFDSNVLQLAVSTVNILDTLGVDYGMLGADEKCCGSVLLRMGDPEFERLFKENIDLLNSLGIETLVSSCAGCYKTIKEDYPKVAPLKFEVLHVVEFLARLIETRRLKFDFPVEKVITYHDPCHLGRAAGIFKAPRTIMAAIPGLNLIEMPRSREYSRCCGSGGGVKSGFPDLQNKMSRARVKEAEATGAQELVSACPFCYQGLQIGLTAENSPLIMRDITYLVEAAMKGRTSTEAAEAARQEKEAKKAAKIGPLEGPTPEEPKEQEPS